MRPSASRVMLVEDSPTQAQRLRSLLESAGMEVIHRGSAEEALEVLESARPDVVLLDYHLPGMNGDEFCREIRLNINTRAIPVLMLTVESGEAAEARGLESGADDYLDKSADADVLLARVRGLLRKSAGAAPILGSERAFSRARLLVVSDSPTYAEFLAQELRAENWAIENAAFDNAGLRQSREFDCLLIDCGGCASTAEGQKRIASVRTEAGSSPAVLLLVGRENKQDMMAWLESGADDYLAKSVDPALLRARIRALLRRKALLDENRRIAEELAENQLQAERARAEKEAAELRATMADRLQAANRELEAANRRLHEALEVTKAITDNAAEGLFLINRDARVQFVSPAASAIFGYQPEEFLRRSLHEVLHHHYRDGRVFPASECPALNAFARGSSYSTHDDIFFRKDGTPVDVAYSMSPIATEGAVAGAVVVVHDVSERKRAEERLRQAQELEHIGLLAGGIAHDFNNLLVGVIGNASLAGDLLPEGHPAAECLSGIVKSGEMAAHLTRQLLAYAGKGRFVLQAVNVSTLARESLAVIERSIPPRIAFQMGLDPALPPIQTDPSQLQQVLMNLVLNAAEAIGERSGLIRLRTGEARVAPERIDSEFGAWPVQPGRFLFIEVEDTGCGMDEETKSRIFDPFFTTKFHGRGLGLAAVAGIVRGHKGAITVQTAPGAGAIFRVWLPVSTHAAEEPPPLARTPDAAPPAGEGTVMVVDDETLVREVARKALERSGYRVLPAESGRAAVDTLRTHGEIDAVVLDLSMPGMSGQETLENLRAIRPDLKVIVSSGYNEAEARRIFGGERIAGFLQKPYSAQDLARKLQDAFKSPEAADRR